MQINVCHVTKKTKIPNERTKSKLTRIVALVFFQGSRMGYRKEASLAEREKGILGREET